VLSDECLVAIRRMINARGGHSSSRPSWRR
jgi:hypothetical protein